MLNQRWKAGNPSEMEFAFSEDQTLPPVGTDLLLRGRTGKIERFRAVPFCVVLDWQGVEKCSERWQSKGLKGEYVELLGSPSILSPVFSAIEECSYAGSGRFSTP
jgi:hypothetical protein